MGNGQKSCSIDGILGMIRGANCFLEARFTCRSEIWMLIRDVQYCKSASWIRWITEEKYNSTAVQPLITSHLVTFDLVGLPRSSHDMVEWWEAASQEV